MLGPTLGADLHHTRRVGGDYGLSTIPDGTTGSDEDPVAEQAGTLGLRANATVGLRATACLDRHWCVSGEPRVSFTAFRTDPGHAAAGVGGSLSVTVARK